MIKEKNNKLRNIIICCAAFCVLYIIFAVYPLSTELHFTPEWTQDISYVQDQKESDVLLPFKASQNIGYFTPDGRIIKSMTYPFKATISSSYYSLFGADNSSSEIYSSQGESLGIINQAGYPFYDQNRLYNFLPGGTGFSCFNEKGEQLWQYESYTPVTAFSSSKGATAAGFADGTLISFTPEGNIDQKFNPGGSSTPIILGLDISNDGSLIACVSGINKQRFVLAQKNGEHSKIIFHEYLDKDFAHQLKVKFNSKADTVYYNYNGGLGIVDINHLKSSHIPLKGTVIQIEECEKEDLIFALSHYKDTYTVTAIEPFDHVAGTFSFKASGSFIQVYQDALFVGKDNKISRITLSRR